MTKKLLVDNEAYYEEHILPLLKKVYDMCEAKDIPVVVCAQIKTTTDGGTLATSYYNSDNDDLASQKLSMVAAILKGEAKAVRVSEQALGMPRGLEEALDGILEKLSGSRSSDDDDDDDLSSRATAPGSNTVN